jgi:hypothetical protein
MNEALFFATFIGSVRNYYVELEAIAVNDFAADNSLVLCKKGLNKYALYLT